MTDPTPPPPWDRCRICRGPILRTDTYYDLDGIRPVCAKCCELRREAGR